MRGPFQEPTTGVPTSIPGVENPPRGDLTKIPPPLDSSSLTKTQLLKLKWAEEKGDCRYSSVVIIIRSALPCKVILQIQILCCYSIKFTSYLYFSYESNMFFYFTSSLTFSHFIPLTF